MSLPHIPPLREATSGGNFMQSQGQRIHEDIMAYLFKIQEINAKPNRTPDDVKKRGELENELFEIVKCVFRGNPSTDSGLMCPPIPIQSVQ
jgi:hypothetical protein